MSPSRRKPSRGFWDEDSVVSNIARRAYAKMKRKEGMMYKIPNGI